MKSLAIGAASLMGALVLAACVANNALTSRSGIPTATVNSSVNITQEHSMNTPANSTTDEVAIREVSDRQGAAMLAADVGTLGQILSDSFTLTHITGYEQSKSEWLAQITSEQMQYHSMTEVSWAVTIDGDTAVIESRSRVDATIYGSRRVWPLAFTTYLRKMGGRWIIERSVATTFQR